MRPSSTFPCAFCWTAANPWIAKTSGESKFLYAQRLAATFAYLALLHLDTAAVIPFADRLQKPLVVSGGRDRLVAGSAISGRTILRRNGTDLFASVKEFVGNFSSRGIVIVISDFFDEQGCERAVEMLRSAGHDFVLLQVHSAEEQRPIGRRRTDSGRRRNRRAAHRGVFAAKHRALRTPVLEFSERLRRLAIRNGGRYARAVTNIPYQDFVLRSLRSGQVLA